MLGKQSNSQTRPYALGVLPQSSVYGASIPVIYGRTRIAPYLIWTQNLHQTGGSSKGKKAGKSPSTYAAAVDFLAGHNPLIGALQFWKNKDKLGLDFDVQSQSITPGVEDSITVSDPDFYLILGVTLELSYSETFNDYGGQGSVGYSGSFERPLWNSALVGPDWTNMSGWRWFPYTFRWVPGVGATIDIDNNKYGLWPAGTLRIYFAKSNGSFPLGVLNLQMEGQLGEGTEYSGYSAQQVIYHAYMGLGSEAFDLGATQMLPQINAEILGTHPVYPAGDADFADMVEDIFKGVAQSAPGNTSGGIAGRVAYTTIHHGLNCYEFPGMIQKKLRTSDDAIATVPYDILTTVPATPGSILIVAARNDSSDPLEISDTQGNTWVKSLLDNPPGKQFWMVYPTANDFNEITIDPADTHSDVHMLEFYGLDGIPAQERFDGTDGPIAGSITLQQPSGHPAYILAVLIADAAATNIQPAAPPAHWNNLMVGQGRIWSMYRIVNEPGVYEFSVNPAFTGDWTLVLIGFANNAPGPDWDTPTKPVGWPKPLGNILDDESMQQSRDQCRAFGLYGSMAIDSQRKASDLLPDIFAAMNAAPVWSGFMLKCRPWSEVSWVGNGAVYTAPTSAGPVAELLDRDRDFIQDSDGVVVHVERKAQVDASNLVQIQHPNRGSDYNDVTTSQPEAGSIALYGVRKDTPRVLRCIQDVGIARMLAGIDVRRKTYIRNVYRFKLHAKWKLLESMDLVTITDSDIGIDHLPVRITSINETPDWALEVEAEAFIYGVHSPAAVPVNDPSEPDPYAPPVNQAPGNVN